MTFNKLSEKDRKTIKVGAVLMAIILVCGGMNILLSEYSRTSKELDAVKSKFNSVMPNSDGSLTSKQAGLYNIVPVFEIPKKEDIPGETCRKKLMEQLRKAKVNFRDVILQPMANKENACGFRKRNLRCEGKCTFTQAMDLVASLYENPWFIAIEEFKIERNAKNRSQMDMTITISTYIK
jgi:hypothetical protein